MVEKLIELYEYGVNIPSVVVDPALQADLEKTAGMMLMDQLGRTSKTLEFLRFCSAQTNASSVAPSGINGAVFVDLLLPRQDWVEMVQSHPEQCPDAFEAFKNLSSFTLPKENIDYLSSAAVYEEMVEKLLMNGTYDYKNSEEFKNYLEVLEQVKDEVDKKKEIVELGVDLTSAPTIYEALRVAENLAEKMGNALEIAREIKALDESLKQACEWINILSEKEESHGMRRRKDFGDTMDLMDAADTSLDGLTMVYNTLHSTFFTGVLPVIETLDLYGEKNMSKSELAGRFRGTLFQGALEKLAMENQRLIDGAKEFRNNMLYGNTKLEDVYEWFSERRLPVLTIHNVHDLALVQEALSVNSENLTNIVENLQEDLGDNLQELVRTGSQRRKGAGPSGGGGESGVSYLG